MSRETLILFTRYPRAGRTKTRLIPKLGAEGAAQLQREMTEHVLARVWPLLKRRGARLEVRFEGGSRNEMRRWLGSGIRFVPQGDGDLGARLHRAMGQAFDSAAERLVLIGADCPELDVETLTDAFNRLRSHRLVFGPAKDGGYYLIGLGQKLPCLFENIAWGTDNVLSTSVARAHQAGVEPEFLPELADVDEPSDLSVWEQARCASRNISVVIPALNEAKYLPRTLERAAAGQPGEIIVADGGSHDDTIRIAQEYGAKVVTCGASRARQLNAGATLARGEILLFLHADTSGSFGLTELMSITS